MARVSENSNVDALNFSISKAKQRLEDLQSKSASLRSITKPSDNPVNNVEALQIINRNKDNNQYIKNSDFALLQLNVTETSLEEITNIISKAKELAIGQASDFYGPDVRKNVSKEVKQLRNQLLSIANRRLGQRYIFGGHKTNSPPFDYDGNYKGDQNHVNLEVAKDFFVPINLHGSELFYVENDSSIKDEHPLNPFPDMKSSPNFDADVNNDNTDRNNEIIENASRDLASVKTEQDGFNNRISLFGVMDVFYSALNANDTDSIQAILPSLDRALSRIITLRTKVGSVTNSIEQAKTNLESEKINNMKRKSMLVDADVGDLFAELSKQKSILELSYKSGQATLNKNLLDFVR